VRELADDAAEGFFVLRLGRAGVEDCDVHLPPPLRLVNDPCKSHTDAESNDHHLRKASELALFAQLQRHHVGVH
jgi:hypothetical protein